MKLVFGHAKTTEGKNQHNSKHGPANPSFV